jgi:hypothetical protein
MAIEMARPHPARAYSPHAERRRRHRDLGPARELGGARVGPRPVRCYDADEVFPDEVRMLTGDVGGNRAPDTVRTQARWADEETCRAWLIVDTGRQILHREIEPSTGIMIAPPGLAGLIDLHGHAGLELAVVIWRGASTGFLQLYGVRAGALAALASGSFEYAGSVVHLSGVDCVRNRAAVLVTSSAEYDADVGRYDVERRFYAFRIGSLEPVPALTERRSVRPRRLARFPELATPAPFASCTVVLGAS